MKLLQCLSILITDINTVFSRHNVGIVLSAIDGIIWSASRNNLSTTDGIVLSAIGLILIAIEII